MSKPKELILYEGFYWNDIIRAIQAQFDSLPSGFSDEVKKLQAHMSQQGFFRTNRGDDKGLRFVGSFRHTLCGQAFHIWVLPKYLKDSNATSAVMPPVMAAISKTGHLYDFADTAEFLETRWNSSRKDVDPHRLASWLVQDYNTNGIFFVKEKRSHTRKKGRINWPRTISKHIPYLDGDDVFYESPVYTSINRNNQTLLSEIHRCAVREALDYLSNFGQASDSIPPECDPTMLGKLEQYVPIVHKFQRMVFSNREINLLRALEAWCLHQSRHYELPVGTAFFDKVWEDALQRVFGNVPKHFAFGSPEYHLGAKDGNRCKFQLNNDEIPDIIRIFTENDSLRFLLLDAKYYLGQISGVKTFGGTLKAGYQWIAGVPGYKDIAKQVDYRRTLESKYGLTDGTNAFVMPWYDIQGLPLPPASEKDPPWIRHLGYATKGEVDPKTDEICRLLEELGHPLESPKHSRQPSDHEISVVQIKPEWLYEELLRSSPNPQHALELWHFLKQHESAKT